MNMNGIFNWAFNFQVPTTWLGSQNLILVYEQDIIMVYDQEILIKIISSK